MKKRIVLIISSFVTFVLSILSFLQMDEILNSSIRAMKETYASYPEILDKMLNILENHGHTYFIVLACVSIVLSLVIFIYTLKEDHVLKKKGFLIALSLIGVFTGVTSVIEGFFLANVIVLLFSRRKVEEDYPVKREIPVLEREKAGKKELIQGGILLLVYFSQFVWAPFVPDSFEISIVVEIIFDIVVLVLAIVFFSKELLRDIKAWKGNVLAYLHYIFSKYGWGLLIYFAVMALAISLTGNSTSINQQGVDSLPLWYVFPAAVLWAPIVEEIVFRGVLRRFIKKDIIFILVSAFVFGILHTYREDGIVNILVMSFPYATLGGIFAYVYTKTENITCNMFMHAFHNSIGMIMRLFL